MARHRDVRNMDYTDDYDGYDDIYGHSMDDDYYISPSNKQFLFNRENSKEQPKIGEFICTENDIQEEDESDLILELSDCDKARLESCIDEIKATLGSTNISRNEIVKTIMTNNYNIEQCINSILNNIKTLPEVQDKKVPIIVMPESAIPTTVVASGGKSTTNITKGFELNVPKSSTPRSQSPLSGRVTPIDDLKLTKLKDNNNKTDVEEQYKIDRDGFKDHLYMVVIGHVDAGKSTLMGHLLCKLGQINQKTMHKYEQESKKLGKQSFMYAWVLDETGEERNRGITMDVGRYQFETKTKLITLLDAPGHKDFIPNMISGAGQADVALLVVDATRGEFETGFDYGGQTREHALLVRSLGVNQLTVAINKLDTVSWSKIRFDDIVQKLKTFLKHAGFREIDITFVPCSGLTGQNLVDKPTENELLTWYDGPCLLDVLDNFRSPERPIMKPFRLSINDIFKGTGSAFNIAGKIENGSLNAGDRIMICPNKEMAIAKTIYTDDIPKTIAFAGDHVIITLSGIEMQNVSIGNILCDPQNPVQITTKFHARLVVFNLTVPITRGYSVLLHHQSLVEPVIISKLITQLNRSTGEIIKKHPRFLNNNTSAIVEIDVSRPIAIELYSDCKELGRIMLRVGGVTIAAGLIIKIIL